MSQIVQQPDAHFPLCDVDDAIIKRQKRRMPAPSIKAAAIPTTTTEGDGEEQQQQAEGSVATSTAAVAPEAAVRRASKMVTLPGKVKPHYALVVAVVVLTK